MEVSRSSPIPVSMDGAGSGWRTPSASRSYCMKTRFQISRICPASVISSNSSCDTWVPPAVAGGLGAAIDVDLAAGAAGAGVGHLPEVVLVAELEDARRGEPGDLLPE